MIYLDNAATTPISKSVINEMNRLMDYPFWGNPSSIHELGFMANNELKKARQTIADLMHVKSEQVLFTSGGSEGNTWAIESLSKIVAHNYKFEMITDRVEHASVLNEINKLDKKGFYTHYIDYPFSIDKLKSILESNKNIGFVSLMAINNEVGTILPYEEVAKVCKKYKVRLHLDCVQLIPHHIGKIDADIITASAHKFNGPKGCGFIIVKNPNLLHPLIAGGKQELGLRGGTENLPAIGGMAVALKERKELLDSILPDSTFQKQLLFKEILTNKISGIQFNDNGLSTIINFYAPNIDVEAVGILLNKQEVYVSTASACSSGLSKPSHVLTAMGYDDVRASNSIRISFDYNTYSKELEDAATIISDTIVKWRGY